MEKIQAEKLILKELEISKVDKNSFGWKVVYEDGMGVFHYKTAKELKSFVKKHIKKLPDCDFRE